MDELKRKAQQRYLGGSLGPGLTVEQLTRGPFLSPRDARPGFAAGTAIAEQLYFPAPAAALDVPTIGASTAKGYDNSTTVTTSALTTQATTSILVFAQWETTSTPPTITDSKGNTYGSPIRTVAPGAGSIPNYLGAWFVSGATGGSSHTFTATGGASTFPSIWVVEVVDAATVTHVGAGSTASPYNSGNLVTTGDTRLVGFAGAENTSTVTHTINSSGYTTLNQLTDGAAAWTGITAHREAVAGTYSFDVSVTSSQDGGAILVALAKGAGPSDAGYIEVWNGSAWVRKPVKVWTGSAWVTKPVKYWNGSTWSNS